MEYRYFKGDLTQEPLKTIRKTWLKAREIRDEKLKAIFDTMPYYNGWLGNEDRIWGILCKADNPALEQLRGEKGYKISQYDEEYYAIKADNRYKVGKLFTQQIDIIRQELGKAPSFSSVSLKQLGLNYWVYNLDRAYKSVAGVAGNIFLTRIPVPVEDRKYGGDEFPTIPDFLTEIKESEFLAIQGK